MNIQKLYRRITDEYSERILNWAVRKTGSRPDGEDLTQEVLYQIFLAAAREKEIGKLENFIWKVAHFVWCNNLRCLKKERAKVSIDEVSIPDSNVYFEDDIVNQSVMEDELAHMRRRIASLSKIQREAMILYYLDGLSVREVAGRLGITEGAVKWHLFDARKKMKKEWSCVKNDNSFVYRPGSLSVAISGNSGPDPDTKRVNDSLIRQNLCLLCYYEGKTVDDLEKSTGIPKPYLEFDLEWLVKREFMKLEGTKYYTTFYISDRKMWQLVGSIFKENKEQYVDVLLDLLKESEAKIKDIGFFGSDLPFERMLWSLIMLYVSYMSGNSPACIRLGSNKQRPIRPDGGYYYPLGFNTSTDQEIDENGFKAHRGWDRGFNGVMTHSPAKNEWIIWLGLYNFIENPYEFVGMCDERSAAIWHNLFCSLVKPGFNASDLADDDKEKLAKAVQNNWVIKTAEVYRPNFIILSSSEFSKLKNDIFKPIMNKLEPITEKLISRFIAELKKALPPQVRVNIDYLAYMDMYNLVYYAAMFADMNKMLYMPKTPEEGALLTLVMVYDG